MKSWTCSVGRTVSQAPCAGSMLENPGSAPRGNMAVSLKDHMRVSHSRIREAPWSLIITTSTDSAALAVKDRVSVPGQMRKRLRSARPIRKMKMRPSNPSAKASRASQPSKPAARVARDACLDERCFVRPLNFVLSFLCFYLLSHHGRGIWIMKT